MSNDQTEREKFIDAMRKTLTLLSREDAAYWWDMRDRSALAWQARAALDGGAVSQDAKAKARIRDEMLADYARIYKYPTPAEMVDAFNKYYEDFAGVSALERMSTVDLNQWFKERGEDPSEVVERHSALIAGSIAALRTPQPQQDEARDLLIRFATWFDRCSERPLHAHEISDSIDAFLATQDNPCWTDDQIARGLDKAFDRLVSAPQPQDEARELLMRFTKYYRTKKHHGESWEMIVRNFLAAEKKEPR